MQSRREEIDAFIEELRVDRAKRLYACEKSFMLFSLMYFSKFHFFLMPDFHRDMYKDLNFDGITGVLWIMFRESAKTSLVKIKIVHNICYKKKHFNIWTSFDQKKAEANLFDIALELQTNENLIADFGQLFYEEGLDMIKNSTKKSMNEFITTNKIKVKAYSTGQSPRGEVYAEFRPDFVVLDDIETRKTVVSEARTQQVIDYIDELLSGMSGDADLIVLANRLSNDGSVAYLEEKVKREKTWRVRDVKVIEEGQIVWPDKYVLTDAEAEKINADIEDPKKKKISLETKKRILGETIYNREMMNTVLTDEEREFKMPWLRHFFADDDLSGRARNRYITIDTADSKERKERKARALPDFTGVTVVDWDSENNWNIQYAKKFRLNAPELIDKIFWLWEKFKPICIGVEKKAYEDQVKPYLEQRSQETDVYPVVKELKHGGTNKEDRIRGALQGRAEAGKIRFKKESTDDQDKLRAELWDFPSAKFDDLTDALAYINQIGKRPFKPKDSNVPRTVNEEFYLNKKDKKSVGDIIRRL